MTALSPFWKAMPSGRAFDFANPRPDMVCLDDIVHVLARVNRWGGNIEPVTFSVAQHSLLVASACKLPQSRPYALLHDAAETYTGDMVSPFKAWLEHQGAGVVALEMRILFTAVFPALGIALPTPVITRDVHQADQVAMATEYRDIAKGRHPDFVPKAPPLRTRIKFMPVPRVEEEFRKALEGALRQARDDA
ncbi:MAG: hypothetical protein KIT02_10465 [Devosia sp.]|uniref:hypothetical protein n=1 Tax=Devosia sp. TaxID=1871048 RepID=UPI0024C6534C|nr:hypothetical protein [Devosia sp.]UYN98389.1 MAG: hypothetical protein KIT02_10465 [Devosia sp.]